MTRAPRPTQLPLDLPHDASFDADDFFVTASNEAAYARIAAWPDWTGIGLALVGPPGSGKSHLASIWAGMADARTVRCEDLDVDTVFALAPGGAVVIEDAPSSRLDERALFHLMNLAAQSGASLLITTHVSPPAWSVTLPDLATRLRALAEVSLQAPDDALLRAVTVKLFADRQVLVDEALVSYLLSRSERSLAAVRALVERLDRRALAEHARLTRAFAARVLRGTGPREE
jgi:chromosomal replication initiation ATPase DnaA